MNYAEASYFDGAHVAHIAAWLDHRRLEGIGARIGRDRPEASNRRRAQHKRGWASPAPERRQPFGGISAVIQLAMVP